MGSTVFVEKPRGDALRITNPTGVALVVAEFTVIAGKALVASEAIGIAGDGALEDALGKVIQCADFDSGETTFASAELPVYWDPSSKKFSNTATVGHYFVGYTLAAKSGAGVLRFVAATPILIPSDYSTLNAALTAEVTARGLVHSLAGARFFRKTVTLTSAAAAAGVEIVADAEVTGGNKVFITDLLFNVNGATAWGTTATVTVQDTAGSPVVAATAAVAQLTGNAILGKHSVGITLAAPIITGVGLTAAKGIRAKGNANGTGSDLLITVVGIIAAA